DGLPGDEIFSVFADSRGRVWIGTIGQAQEDGLSYWDPATGRIHAFNGAEGLPRKPLPTAFGEDRDGNIWADIYHGGIVRYRHGRWTLYRDGVPGVAWSFLLDP